MLQPNVPGDPAGASCCCHGICTIGLSGSFAAWHQTTSNPRDRGHQKSGIYIYICFEVAKHMFFSSEMWWVTEALRCLASGDGFWVGHGNHLGSGGDAGPWWPNQILVTGCPKTIKLGLITTTPRCINIPKWQSRWWFQTFIVTLV